MTDKSKPNNSLTKIELLRIHISNYKEVQWILDELEEEIDCLKKQSLYDISLNADTVGTILALLENPKMITDSEPPTNEIAKGCIDILHCVIGEWQGRIEEAKAKERTDGKD